MRRLTVQEAVEAMERGLFGKSLPSLRSFLDGRNLDVEEDLDTFYGQVLRVVRERTEEGVRALFQSLGATFPLEVEERLRNGLWVRLRYSPDSKVGLVGKLALVDSRGGDLEEELSVPFFDYWGMGSFELHTLRGALDFRTRFGLHIVRGNAYLRALSQRSVEEALNTARGLRPFFSAVELPDLGGAIEVLAELKPGESRIEGDYVLARGDGWLLRRGLIFRDPSLDKALLLGGPVTLSFPGDVEISFRATWEAGVILKDLRIRWGEEEADFSGRYFRASVFVENPVAQAIQDGLRLEVRSFEEGWGPPLMGREWTDVYSPRMWAFLKAFAYHEDPFRALAEGRFHAHVTGELFLGL